MKDHVFMTPFRGPGQFPVGGAATLHVFAGPALGFNTTSEFEVDAEEGSTETDEIDEAKGSDFGADVGAGVDFDVGATVLSLDARYHIGMTNILDEEELSFQNRALMFTAGIAF